MANLPETSNFDSGVNELATTDLVLGGVSGAANAGPINLTNRTRWLYDQNTATQAALSSIDGDLSTIDGQIASLNTSVTAINTNLATINGQLPSLAPLGSPAFSGTPTAPTPPPGTNGTRLATTAFVAASFAPIDSPALTGSPTAPTAASGTSSTVIATTAFVNRGSSKNPNGYRINPDGSIEQWCFVQQHFGTGHPDDIAVTFPMSFPSACWGVWPATTDRSFAGNGTSASGSNYSSSVTLSGCTVTLEEGTPAGTASGYVRMVGD